MSQLSKYIHEHYGTPTDNKPVSDIVVELLGDHLGDTKDLVGEAVALVEGTSLSGDQKRQLATTIIGFFLKSIGISVPASVVSYLIEEAVLLLKRGKSSTPAVPIDPTSEGGWQIYSMA